MTSNYTPDNTLALSGIQHFNFCRRQWALIHVERQWKENALTVDGRILHRRADDPFFSEVRNGVVIARSMPVVSYRLGLYGVCDVVEFTPDDNGVLLAGRAGRFRPMPVEYKRGKEKMDGSDEVQLCAQVICLEEMLSTCIERASFYYGETRRRVDVEIGQELRDRVANLAREMHSYYDRGYTPRVRVTKACKSCSLQDICLPELEKNKMTVAAYIQKHVEDD